MNVTGSSVKNNVLFVGAHSDDLEIGMGGTISKLISKGWHPWYLVLTSEADESLRNVRRQEAISSAAILGVDQDRVIFADFQDGHLQCNGDTVGELRKILAKHDVVPDLVFTHSGSDSHNDHRAAHELCKAAFRRKLIMCYPVVNSFELTDFKPMVFIDISEHQKVKAEALGYFSSQKGRIDYSAIESLTTRFASRFGFQYTEMFEVLIQQGADRAKVLIAELNDCPFIKFWYNIIGGEGLIIVHAVPVYRKNKDWNWQTDKDREGIAVIRRAFKKYWIAGDPTDDYSCATPGIEKMVESSHVLLSGGAVSNKITNQYFNYFDGIRYVIGYSMPDYKNIHIWDRKTKEKKKAEYVDDEYGNRSVAVDKGILTVMESPLSSGKKLIGCMGIHGFGTLGVYKALSHRSYLNELSKITGDGSNNQGWQVIIHYDTIHNEVKIDEGSLHFITS